MIVARLVLDGHEVCLTVTGSGVHILLDSQHYVCSMSWEKLLGARVRVDQKNARARKRGSWEVSRLPRRYGRNRAEINDMMEWRLNGMTYKEVAERAGLSTEMVRQYLFQWHKPSLRSKLGPRFYDEVMGVRIPRRA